MQVAFYLEHNVTLMEELFKLEYGNNLFRTKTYHTFVYLIHVSLILVSVVGDQVSI